PFVGLRWPCSLLTAALAGVIAWVAPAALPFAAPVLALWLFSPLVAYFVSRPLPQKEPPLRPDSERALHALARRTWGFFEHFVGPEDHWLPPDNYQEDPNEVVAHRTSPTNCGLLLLSTAAAHDLGYVTLPELLRRVGNTFDALNELERHRGHFFNWYDTTTLRPLPPEYVSTVDSGNLLGCLWALKQALLENRDEVVPGPSALSGLRDTLDMIAEEL